MDNESIVMQLVIYTLITYHRFNKNAKNVKDGYYYGYQVLKVK